MKLQKITERASRRYEDACGTAHGLDLLGERWALLVVRELMFGARRFGDLKASLHGVSANVLTQRLEGLEASGIVRRRRLPPPASVQVYELTEWGEEAEPIILSLGRWAIRSPWHDASLALTPAAYTEGTEAALWKEVVQTFPAFAWRGSATTTTTLGASLHALRAALAAQPAAADKLSVATYFPPLSTRRSMAFASGGQKLDAACTSSFEESDAALWVGIPDAAIPVAVAAVRGAAVEARIAAAAPMLTRPVDVSTPARARSVRVGLLGARGYVGREFVRLLAGHPEMQVRRTHVRIPRARACACGRLLDSA
ncbi:transcriptional regulator [archaeon]|nr:MAG: transcriptional regulator [archaeon]